MDEVLLLAVLLFTDFGANEEAGLFRKSLVGPLRSESSLASTLDSLSSTIFDGSGTCSRLLERVVQTF
jgi:hypothetical protein